MKHRFPPAISLPVSINADCAETKVVFAKTAPVGVREPAWHHRARHCRRRARTLLRSDAGHPTSGDQMQLEIAEAEFQRHQASCAPMLENGDAVSGRKQDLREFDLQQADCQVCRPKTAIRKGVKMQRASLPRTNSPSTIGSANSADHHDLAATIAAFERLVQDGQGATGIHGRA